MWGEAIGSSTPGCPYFPDRCTCPQESFPVSASRKRKKAGRPADLKTNIITRLKNQLKWARRARRKAELALERLQRAKERAGAHRTSPEFLAKVALSRPHTCARGFADAWRDLVGVGKLGCSRRTITRIRDAFAEVVKEHSTHQLRLLAKHAAARSPPSAAPLPGAVAAAPAPALPALPSPASPAALAPESAAQAPGAVAVAQAPALPSPSSASSAALAPGPAVSGFGCAALMHMHDEAGLRLRSQAPADGPAPGRGRSSAVQQHIAVAHFPGGHSVRCLTELDALGDKGARTLATSLRNVLWPIADTIGAAVAVEGPVEMPWFMHILVSDGAAVNEAAAKVVLAWVQRDGLPGRQRYFVLTVRCANHQTNLTIASAVSGRAALLGTTNAAALGAGPLAGRHAVAAANHLGDAVCGAIVRFAKYLVPEYFADLSANLADIVSRLQARPLTLERERQQSVWQDMRLLYGAGVFPDKLLSLLNCGLGEWSHALSPADGYTPEEQLQNCRDELLQLLRRRLLVADEQPTLTRMFTFVGHVEAFLLLDFLGCWAELLQSRGKSQRERSRKRVVKVLAFARAPGVSQYLRRTVLALRLTGHAMGLCAQLGSDQEPLLVRLAKGTVSDVVAADLGRLLGDLHLDPGLDYAACVALLMATVMELFLRFREYSKWPYAAWALCKHYNPEAYIVSCLAFLEEPEDNLDQGFGLPLRRLAHRRGATTLLRLEWLVGESVQGALRLTFEASAASSLPVERAFAEAKRSEAPRLCHVATAGRNQILKQFLRERGEVLKQAEAAAALLRRSMRTNLASLAWEKCPALRAAGQGQATREFIRSNEHMLKAELQRRKEEARAAVVRVEAPGVRVTQADWTAYFRENGDEFFQRMGTASARRRAANRRLQPAPDVPAAVRRLAPAACRPPASAWSRWQQVLLGRSGFFAVTTRPSRLRLLFVLVWHERTYALDMTRWRQGQVFFLGINDCEKLADKVVPLSSLDFDPVETTCEVSMQATAVLGGVQLRIHRARVLLEPLARPRRATGQRGSRTDFDEQASDEEDEDKDALGHIAATMAGSDVESSDCSVDTDEDSGLEDALVAARHRQDNEDVGVSDLDEADDGAPALGSGSGAAPGQQDDEDVEETAEEPRRRHAAGTWTIWQSQWFYMTQTPGYMDVKMWVKHALRNPVTGMGARWFSKTLSPHHFGEEIDAPRRTSLLLRSWAVWRAQRNEWAFARPCRMRELERESARLLADLREAVGESPEAPLLNNIGADSLLRQWVPQLVGQLMPPAQRQPR